MTTKEQERKALEQIRKIVAGLGEDSYIGTAFEGCFKVAEDNIENDWACSMKERAEIAERNLVLERNRMMQMQKELDAREQEVKELQEEIEYLRKRGLELVLECEKEAQNAIAETKEVKVETVDGVDYYGRFARIQFFNNDGFKFINVVQNSGWTTSYKIDDLKTFEIH